MGIKSSRMVHDYNDEDDIRSETSDKFILDPAREVNDFFITGLSLYESTIHRKEIKINFQPKIYKYNYTPYTTNDKGCILITALPGYVVLKWQISKCRSIRFTQTCISPDLHDYIQVQISIWKSAKHCAMMLPYLKQNDQNIFMTYSASSISYKTNLDNSSGSYSVTNLDNIEFMYIVLKVLHPCSLLIEAPPDYVCYPSTTTTSTFNNLKCTSCHKDTNCRSDCLSYQDDTAKLEQLCNTCYNFNHICSICNENTTCQNYSHKRIMCVSCSNKSRYNDDIRIKPSDLI